MWPFNKDKKQQPKKRRATQGNPIPGMEHDPKEDGNPNVVYDLDKIFEELNKNERN